MKWLLTGFLVLFLLVPIYAAGQQGSGNRQNPTTVVQGEGG